MPTEAKQLSAFGTGPVASASHSEENSLENTISTSNRYTNIWGTPSVARNGRDNTILRGSSMEGRSSVTATLALPPPTTSDAGSSHWQQRWWSASEPTVQMQPSARPTPANTYRVDRAIDRRTSLGSQPEYSTGAIGSGSRRDASNPPSRDELEVADQLERLALRSTPPASIVYTNPWASSSTVPVRPPQSAVQPSWHPNGFGPRARPPGSAAADHLPPPTLQNRAHEPSSLTAFSHQHPNLRSNGVPQSPLTQNGVSRPPGASSLSQPDPSTYLYGPDSYRSYPLLPFGANTPASNTFSGFISIPPQLLPNAQAGLQAVLQQPTAPARRQTTPALALNGNDGKVRSPLLEEFRNSSRPNKRLSLKDIEGHVVEFSGDQYGSRFIQAKLETANSDEKERILEEIKENAVPLMRDVFGNYVIQKLIEHGSQVQKTALALFMKGHVVDLSTQMYGCRVIQKALDYVLVEQQLELMNELKGDVVKVIRDQNGNHVVQKILAIVPPQHTRFILDAFKGQACALAQHTYGCRVIQRILERCSPEDKSGLIGELLREASRLMVDQYGNYVMQHLLTHGNAESRSRITHAVCSDIMTLSRHKFASNVVERCIETASDEDAIIIRNLFLSSDAEGDCLLAVTRDQFGNYVMQRLLNRLEGEDHEQLEARILLILPVLERICPPRQVQKLSKTLKSLGGQDGGVAANRTGAGSRCMSSASTPPPARTASNSSAQSTSTTSTPATNTPDTSSPPSAVAIAVGSARDVGSR